MSGPFCKKICEKSSFYYPSNNMSTKQLQSKMIQIHKKISYNNTKVSTLLNTILQLDYDLNRKLLLSCKYNVYIRYLKQLLEGNITTDKKRELNQLFSTLLSSLNEKEIAIVYGRTQTPFKTTITRQVPCRSTGYR